MVSKNWLVGIKIIIFIEYWYFMGIWKWENLWATWVIIWVNTILNRKDTRVILLRYDCSCIIGRPKWYWKWNYRQIPILNTVKSHEILITNTQMALKKKQKKNGDTDPTLVLTPLDHFLKLRTCWKWGLNSLLEHEFLGNLKGYPTKLCKERENYSYEWSNTPKLHNKVKFFQHEEFILKVLSARQ